jgi:Fe-S-cluster containining protein
MIEPDGKEHICERCGECCVNGSPTLHLSDFKLFKENIVTLTDVYTLRKGELVYDNIGEDLDYLKEEMMKIKERPGAKTCIFYDPENRDCQIYETRPLQCVYFECWNPKKFLETLSEDKLSRGDLFNMVPVIREFVETHEERCSYKKLEELFEKTQEGSDDAAEEILGILEYDTAIRPFIVEKLNVPAESTDLIFGRPLIDTIKMFGYKVEKDDEGNYCLLVDKDYIEK